MKYLDELFKNELEVLEAAMADIDNPGYVDNKLLSKYRELAFNYRKLLKLTSKAFNISDTQGKELKRRESEVKNLLDNSNQGFLTFGENLIVNKEYSSECVRIFNRKIGALNILELLSSENYDQNELFANVFQSFFKTSDINEKSLLLQKLPTMLKLNNNYVNIKYKIIEHDEFEADYDLIMLILTDITEKRKAEDQVLYLSYHDKLTSLYNRAYIDSIIPQLQSEQNMPLSIIIGDMNGLKLSNDVFGHECGDNLLISAAKVLLACCRKSDIVARWGGDEFLIVLPATDMEACKNVCDRIKEMCSSVEQNPIRLSISLGSATMENLNTDISKLFSIAENMMYSNKLMESKRVRRNIILSMEKTLHEKCFEDTGHTGRIKSLALKFAEVLGNKLEPADLSNLALLANLHDIGKVAIPKEILGKEGSLTESEWGIMKTHTEIGFRMAQSIDEPALAQSILSIRERWDGSGYPCGLSKEQIPLIARMVSIVDAYDVMTHNRPYKCAISREDALEEIKKSSGKQFDPELVGLFLDNINNLE